MIFDMKMEDFRCKARYIVVGHMKNSLTTIKYASVVGRETVQIALTLAALNGIEVKSSDIENSDVTAPVTKKICTNLGEYFGADSGKKSIIVRTLYGLKPSGSAFRNHLADCMIHIGYTSCIADPDLWIKPITKANGEIYYSNILNYVNDILVISEEAGPILARLGIIF